MKLTRLTKSISLALLATSSAHSAEFIVTTTGDPGGGTPFEISPDVFEIDTLRSAIEQADNENLFSGADTIRFDERIFTGGEADINLNIIGDRFVFGGTSNSAFGINSEITVARPTAATLKLIAGDLRHFQVNSGGQLNLSDVTLDGGSVPLNNVSGKGGSIYSRSGSSINVSHCTFTNNTARTGGAIHLNGQASTIEDSQFTGNIGNNNAGAVFQDSSISSTITRSTFSENASSNSSGGVLFLAGALVIDSSTFYNNTSGSSGGAIGTNNVGVLTLTNSTVANNKAESRGGGILISSDPGEGVSIIINSTVTGNQSLFNRSPAVQPINLQRGGGEVYFDTSGGGVYVDEYTDRLILHNTVITNNTETTAMLADDMAASPLPESSHNFIGVGDSVLAITDGSNGNQIGTSDVPIDAALQPLANNGGSTLTQLPNPISPAIDAGNNAFCESIDQRGNIRPQDGDEDGSADCDIGAVEIGDVSDLIFKDGFDAN